MKTLREFWNENSSGENKGGTWDDRRPPIIIVECGPNYLEMEEIEGCLYISDVNSSAQEVGPSDDKLDLENKIIAPWWSVLNDGLAWYDLDPYAADLWVFEGPDGYNVDELDPDNLPESQIGVSDFRMITDEEWENHHQRIKIYTKGGE